MHANPCARKMYKNNVIYVWENFCENNVDFLDDSTLSDDGNLSQLNNVPRRKFSTEIVDTE
jgi:hypothetical protein